MSSLTRSLWLVATLALFVLASLGLDERRISFGALPVTGFATHASSAAADSALAIDAAAETAWRSDGVAGEWWQVNFPSPLTLRGLVLDTGNFGPDSAQLVPFGVSVADGSQKTLERLAHRRRFRIWHEFTWEPAAVAGLLLRPLPGAEAGRARRCTLRDVRFLVDEGAASAADRPADPAPPGWSLRGAWLPLLLAAGWVWWWTAAGRTSRE